MRPAIKFRSKKEFVYETLRDGIMNGDFAPNARLIIDDLSAELGVSPIPVREALQQLQADGFVTIEPYVGARVADLHQGQISEVFALLEALETLSSRAACQRMTEDDFAEMEALVRRMDLSVDHPEEWSQENVELHQFICTKAGMTLVQNFLSLVIEHWNRVRRYYLEDVFSIRIREAQAEHRHLLEAMRTRDPDYVTTIIHEHNQRALHAYLAHLEGQTVQA